MKGAYVLDSSVALTWIFTGQGTSKTQELLEELSDGTAVVPGWWYLEISNVLALAERRQQITAVRSAAFVEELGTLDIQVDEIDPSYAFTQILPLCRAYGLTSYDAVYLDLAMRRALRLATLDKQLRRAARSAGLEVLG